MILTRSVCAAACMPQNTEGISPPHGSILTWSAKTQAGLRCSAALQSVTISEAGRRLTYGPIIACFQGGPPTIPPSGSLPLNRSPITGPPGLTCYSLMGSPNGGQYRASSSWKERRIWGAEPSTPGDLRRSAVLVVISHSGGFPGTSPLACDTRQRWVGGAPFW
jgi:hypothetical protein